MKKFFLLILSVMLWSCDDGDIDLPAFEFEEQLYNCDLKDSSYTLFRMGVSEAIIVTLPQDVFRNEVSQVPFEVSITDKNVIYRTFSSTISASYFCNDVPPVDPTITSNWTGVSGASNKIFINTIEEFDNLNVLIGYRHRITFQNLKVEKESEYLAFEEGDFGEIVTLL